MLIYKVGDGWPPAERDFDTITDFYQAVDPSVLNKALCRGRVLTSNDYITGSFPNGLIVESDIPYDGSNKDAIAWADAALGIGTSNVIVRWLRLDGPTGFLQSARIINNNTSNSFFEECYISAKPTNTTGVIASNNTGSNRGFRRCYIDFSGRSVGYSTGWGTSITLDGNILFGYTNTAIQSTTGGGTADRHIINNIAVEGTGNDLNITQFATYANNATADSTGQYTGYSKAEFVDFDGGDKRIRANSDLRVLGIGAFYEEQPAGPVEYEGTISVSASLSIILTSNKVAMGPSSIASDASIHLLSNKRAIGRPTATADTDIHLSSNKQASGDAGITAAAQMQVTAAKLAASSVTLDAIASTSLAGNKIAAAAASIPATASGILYGSKCASSAISFDINASATALGSKLAWGSFDVPLSISVSISGSSDMEIPAAPAAKVVFITSQSFTRHQVATQSKRHRHIHTGGSRA